MLIGINGGYFPAICRVCCIFFYRFISKLCFFIFIFLFIATLRSHFEITFNLVFFPTFFLFPIFRSINLYLSLSLYFFWFRSSFILSFNWSFFLSPFYPFNGSFLCSNAKPSPWICYIYLSIVFGLFQSYLRVYVCFCVCVCAFVYVALTSLFSHFC